MKLFFLLLFLTGLANAHYRFTALIFDGKTTGEYEYIRAYTSRNSPVTNISSIDVRCNTGGLTTGPSTKVADVKAGSQIGFASERLSHPGPLAIYMSKAPEDVQNYDGSGGWFKVLELGAIINGDTLSWKADGLTNVTFKIPPSTPPGQYLVRAEHTALHGASNDYGAQMYISCGQINVSGPGGGNPTPQIRLPGGYRPNDPGLKINIYWPPVRSYTPPGPRVWKG